MTMAKKIKNYQRLTHYNENTRKAVVYDYISMSPEWSPIVNRLAAFEDAIESGEILLKEDADKLKSENAALRERLEKTVELPARVMIERTIVNGKFKPTQKAQAFNGRIGVVYRDETRYKGLLVDICSEKVSDYEAAEARLAELKGGEG